MINVYADLCSNHKGNLATYNELIEAVDSAGAIPKIQLFNDQTFNRAWEPPEQFVASVFRPSDLDYVVPLAPLALKIASVESTHFELIKACKATNLPIIISTGGMDGAELLQLMDILGDYEPGISLMHCVALYPTPPGSANLYRLYQLAETIDTYGYDYNLGWSCHIDPRTNLSAIMSMAAMAYVFGAVDFEVHVRPQKGQVKTPDEIVALTPHMLTMLVEHLEQVQVWEGDTGLVGADREAVLKWRARWQTV